VGTERERELAEKLDGWTCEGQLDLLSEVQQVG
jgi:hypothetical protein